VIDFLIHYYRTGTEPFRSLSALPDAEAIAIMRSLYVEGSVIWERFKDPADYLEARRQTEVWLRQEFIRLGGQPQEPYPLCVGTLQVGRAYGRPGHATPEIRCRCQSSVRA
jgi:hypothetical protein